MHKDHLRSVSERIIDPPLFRPGDEVCPWQNTSDIAKGQLCIVIRMVGNHLIEIASITTRGQVFTLVAAAWLFENYMEQK